MRNFSESDKSFFLAVGLTKPHLPFNAPKKYWDLYSPQQIHLASNPFPPLNAPYEAIQNGGDILNTKEIRAYHGIPKKGYISDTLAFNLVHGYYACVSYIDKLLGDLMNELQKSGLDENTAIILIGDHGFHLGEHGFWGKHCNYDKVLKAPLIIKAPGQKSCSYTQ